MFAMAERWPWAGMTRGGRRSGGSGGERDREARADHGDAAKWQRRCARGERGAAAAAVTP